MKRILSVILIVVVGFAGCATSDEENVPMTASDFADVYGITQGLAEGIGDGLDRLGLDYEDVSRLEQIHDWAYGERYRMYADYEQYIIYCDSAGMVDGFNQNGEKVYNN
ncbi:MAG: hypothetical protein GXZ02_11045 [Clostridiales bacterium]|nr:hypothetical protein [Clostridiales bacterium]